MLVDINALSAWAALITAIIALAAWITQSRSANFNTKLEILLNKEQLYDSAEMINIRKKAAKDILKSKFESNEATIVFNFFEGLGLLLRRGALDKEMVWNDFSSAVLYYWSSSEEYIKSARIEDERIWENFEYLSKVLISYSKKKYRLKSYDISKTEIKQYLLRETRASNLSLRGRIAKTEVQDS